MKCPTCKKGMMRPWEAMEEHFGVSSLVRGSKCNACSETLVRSAELKRYERDIAVQLVARGVRTGGELKFVRKAAGLRAVDFAELLSVDAKTVSRWETDEVPLPLIAKYVVGDLLEQPKRTRERLAVLAG